VELQGEFLCHCCTASLYEFFSFPDAFYDFRAQGDTVRWQGAVADFSWRGFLECGDDGELQTAFVSGAEESAYGKGGVHVLFAAFAGG
jgi:hypothetical protein